jgi:N-ethylmaleimide reductase
VGRLSDPLVQPGGADPISASAVQPDPNARHYAFMCPKAKRPYGVPRALTTAEVREVVGDYAACAKRALAAGFDGVEIHGASGYLPMQFLTTNTNRRHDEYGGCLEGRSRFLLECVEAMQDATHKDFVAVKVSPGWTFHDVFDDDPIETYTHVARELSKLGIAYLQVGNYGMDWDVYGTLRPHFEGPMIGVAGFTRQSAAEALASKRLDLVAFGQASMANPDLAERFANGWPLNRIHIGTFYTQGSEGYTDYPAFADAEEASLTPVDSRPVPQEV